LEDFAKAVKIAIDDEVDIINISAGIHMPGCQGSCGFCNTVSRLIDDGIFVVAAAGNVWDIEDSDERIYCPSTYDEVISVGGMISVCNCQNNYPGADITDPPSGAFYLNTDNETVQETSPDQPICGQNGCTDEFECIPNQVEKVWVCPRPKNNKPDIFAPCYTSYETVKGEVRSDLGTSFAAPVVTGAVSAVLTEADGKNVETISPGELRQLVRETGKEFGESNKKKLDCMRLLNECNDRVRDS
jgi:hypothetical protein